MARSVVGPEIERLIQLLARLPGLGPRSARRAALAPDEEEEALMQPLAKAMAEAASAVTVCPVCGNVDTQSPCTICRDAGRDASILVVVEDVGDLWALERAGDRADATMCSAACSRRSTESARTTSTSPR